MYSDGYVTGNIKLWVKPVFFASFIEFIRSEQEAPGFKLNPHSVNLNQGDQTCGLSKKCCVPWRFVEAFLKEEGDNYRPDYHGSVALSAIGIKYSYPICRISGLADGIGASLLGKEHTRTSYHGDEQVITPNEGTDIVVEDIIFSSSSIIQVIDKDKPARVDVGIEFRMEPNQELNPAKFVPIFMSNLTDKHKTEIGTVSCWNFSELNIDKNSNNMDAREMAVPQSFSFRCKRGITGAAHLRRCCLADLVNFKAYGSPLVHFNKCRGLPPLTMKKNDKVELRVCLVMP